MWSWWFPAFAGGAEICPQAFSVSEFGAQWEAAGRIALTAPPGAGWTAHVTLTARKRDGTRIDWTEDAVLSAETVPHDVAAPHGDDGTVTLLVARVVYENTDGSILPLSTLGGRFVIATQGAYTDTEERFSGAIENGAFVDPHDALEIDEEVVR